VKFSLIEVPAAVESPRLEPEATTLEVSEAAQQYCEATLVGESRGAGRPVGGEPAGATAAATPRRLFVEKKNQLLEFDATDSGKFGK
jgi:hypothetical protein